MADARHCWTIWFAPCAMSLRQLFPDRIKTAVTGRRTYLVQAGLVVGASLVARFFETL